MVVEVDQVAEGLIDARIARRLIALELADVDMPVDLERRESRRRPTLFYRVFISRAGMIRVELWERGEYHGARSLSPTYGSSQLRSRRVALAAAELARVLRQKRLAAAKLAARPRPGDDAGSCGTGTPPYRIELAARATGALVGPERAWLAGPALGAALRVGRSARLELAISALAGRDAALAERTGLRWLELSLTPSWEVPLGGRASLGLGATAAASAVHASRVAAVDGIAGQRDTWSARAAARPELVVGLSRALGLSVAPELGAALRPVPLTSDAGERAMMGGLWLGLSLGVRLDPGAPQP